MSVRCQSDVSPAKPGQEPSVIHARTSPAVSQSDMHYRACELMI